MSNKCKLVLIYLSMFVITIMLKSIFSTPYEYCNNNAGFILICNSIYFLALIKAFKLNKNTVTKFLAVISMLFIVLIVDKDIFYSSYTQSTPEPLMFPILSFIMYFILIPFTIIFDMLYNLNLFDFSFIFIPVYFICMIFISRAILSYNIIKKDFKADNNSKKV